MEIVNIEARTFEAILSKLEVFADRMEKLCTLYGDMSQKTWLDNQDVCIMLNISLRTLQTLRDNGRLPYSQICHKTYYKPEDVERIDQHLQASLPIKEQFPYKMPYCINRMI